MFSETQEIQTGIERVCTHRGSDKSEHHFTDNFTVIGTSWSHEENIQCRYTCSDKYFPAFIMVLCFTVMFTKKTSKDISVYLDGVLNYIKALLNFHFLLLWGLIITQAKNYFSTLPLGKQTTSKEDNTSKVPSSSLGKIMCFIYSIKYDIPLKIYVKLRFLLLVKLSLINICIQPRVL